MTAAPDASHVAADAGTGARASAGCSAAAHRYAAGSQVGQLDAAGRSRSFIVHLPPEAPAAAAPRPLVIVLHGGLGSAAEVEASTLMSPLADREGFVAVYPDGVSRSWNAGRCCGPPADQDIDDVAFIAALLDHLEAELCLDERRVYVTGMSNGAMLTHRLACELSPRLAAVAPVSGTDMTEACAPPRPVPVMHTHGTEDKHVPWAGGTGCGVADAPFTSVADTINGWVLRNGCAPAAPSLVVEQGDGRCERQAACGAAADVILCTITGGGHSWPGGAPKAAELPACTAAGEGPQSRTFMASEQIWAFFQRHTLP